jgi:enoyl-CoA hydratase/carnithine racemase
VLVISADGADFSVGGDMGMMLNSNRFQAMRDKLMDEVIAII